MDSCQSSIPSTEFHLIIRSGKFASLTLVLLITYIYLLILWELCHLHWKHHQVQRHLLQSTPFCSVQATSCNVRKTNAWIVNGFTVKNCFISYHIIWLKKSVDDFGKMFQLLSSAFKEKPLILRGLTLVKNWFVSVCQYRQMNMLFETSQWMW